MINIGVLALQGSVEEHIKSFSMIEGIAVFRVRTKDNFDMADGLVIPGGESTTIGKLIKDFGLHEFILSKAEEGMPIWGTCAGMILMANEIVNESCVHLGIMNISVRRNAYGCQLDSFSTRTCIPEISCEDIPLVFIRAPWVERVGEGVRILAKVGDRIVAVQQGSLLATSFHPELTENLDFQRYFAGMVKERKNKYDKTTA